MLNFTVSLWITKLSPQGELTSSSWRDQCIFSLWRSNCLLVENSLSFLMEKLLRRACCLLDYRTFLLCRLLDCSPWNNLSWLRWHYSRTLSILVNLLCFTGLLPLEQSFWWCRRCGQTSLIEGNLLFLSLCLFVTFIARLVYCSPFYFMMLSQ